MTLLNVAETSVAGRLRAARILAGLDQTLIGARLGVTRTTVSNWERGNTEPTVSQFIGWARLTHQPVEQLIDGLEWNAESPRDLARGDEGDPYTPRDLNPEPTDYGPDAIRVAAWCNRCQYYYDPELGHRCPVWTVPDSVADLLAIWAAAKAVWS